jgi:hypothetical protein
MVGGKFLLDGLGTLAKQFSDNPKALNILGNTSPITKRAMNKELGLSSEFAISATNALRSGNFKEYRQLAEQARFKHSKNAADHRMSQIQNPTNNEALEKLTEPRYQSFQVDESLSINEQKRVYKKAASDWLFENEVNQKKAVTLADFHKEQGKLRIDGKELDLKSKKTDKITGRRDIQPKPWDTHKKSSLKRQGRERPWKSNKKEIEEILESVGKKEKLAELLALMRTQHNAKVNSIKQAGMSIGHMKALDNGGLDIAENIQPEPLKTISGIPGNAARAARKDLPDSVLNTQGAFTGTLKNYILMKLQELE